jgi:hypothetical protein
MIRTRTNRRASGDRMSWTGVPGGPYVLLDPIEAGVDSH